MMKKVMFDVGELKRSKLDRSRSKKIVLHVHNDIILQYSLPMYKPK